LPHRKRLIPPEGAATEAHRDLLGLAPKYESLYLAPRTKPDQRCGDEHRRNSGGEADFPSHHEKDRESNHRGHVPGSVLGRDHGQAPKAGKHPEHGGSGTLGSSGERQEAPERTEVEVARRDEAREVREAMQTLPGEQLEVVRLAYFGGFTHTQIAEMLDQPVGTVKGRMRLGLEKMRRALAPEEATT